MDVVEDMGRVLDASRAEGEESELGPGDWSLDWEVEGSDERQSFSDKF